MKIRLPFKRRHLETQASIFRRPRLNSHSFTKQGGVYSLSSHQLSSSNWLSWFFVTDSMLHLYIFSIAIFMLTALLNLLTACLSPSRGLAAQDFLLLLIFILSIFLLQELTSIFILSSLTLVNSGTLFFCMFFHLLMTWILSKEECQDISHTKLDRHHLPLFLLLSSVQGLASYKVFLKLF